MDKQVNRYKGGLELLYRKDEAGQGHVMRMRSALDFPGCPMVKDPVQSLIREASTGCSAAKPVSLSI